MTTVFVLQLIDENVILFTPSDLIRGVCAIYDRRNVSKPTYKLYYVKRAADILPKTPWIRYMHLLFLGKQNYLLFFLSFSSCAEYLNLQYLPTFLKKILLTHFVMSVATKQVLHPRAHEIYQQSLSRSSKVAVK